MYGRYTLRASGGCLGVYALALCVSVVGATYDKADIKNNCPGSYLQFRTSTDGGQTWGSATQIGYNSWIYNLPMDRLWQWQHAPSGQPWSGWETLDLRSWYANPPSETDWQAIIGCDYVFPMPDPNTKMIDFKVKNDSRVRRRYEIDLTGDGVADQTFTLEPGEERNIHYERSDGQTNDITIKKWDLVDGLEVPFEWGTIGDDDPGWYDEGDPPPNPDTWHDPGLTPPPSDSSSTTNTIRWDGDESLEEITKIIGEQTINNNYQQNRQIIEQLKLLSNQNTENAQERDYTDVLNEIKNNTADIKDNTEAAKTNLAEIQKNTKASADATGFLSNNVAGASNYLSGFSEGTATGNAAAISNQVGAAIDSAFGALGGTNVTTGTAPAQQSSMWVITIGGKTINLNPRQNAWFLKLLEWSKLIIKWLLCGWYTMAMASALSRDLKALSLAGHKETSGGSEAVVLHVVMAGLFMGLIRLAPLGWVAGVDSYTVYSEFFRGINPLSSENSGLTGSVSVPGQEALALLWEIFPFVDAMVLFSGWIATEWLTAKVLMGVQTARNMVP